MASFTVKFTIKTILHRQDLSASVIATKITCNNARMKKEVRKQMEIRGLFPLSLCQDDEFEATVEKKIDKRYSKTYLNIVGEPKRTGLERDISMAKFLRQRINSTPRQNPKLEKWRISIKTCNELVAALGLDVIPKLIENPIQVLNYPHIKLKEDKLFEMQTILKDCASLQKIAMVIQSSGIPLKIALSLYETYQSETLNVIRDNPYQVCYDEKITFRIADKLAYDLKFDKHNPVRIKTGILDFMKYKRDEGSICIVKKQLYDKGAMTLNQYLNRVGVYQNNSLTEEEINDQIEALIEEGRLVKETDFGCEYLYLPEMHLIEERLSKMVYHLLSNTYNQKFCMENKIHDFLTEYETNTSMKLDSLQKKAVEKALQNKMFILTGGPGTGKTATVNVIVQAIKALSQSLYHRDASIILLAPTGKAAERMTELTNELSSTIHRGLDLGFASHEDIKELDADFVIVDESSMIDVFLMYDLLKSLTERTRIIFVGDVNQLPSVGPGKILWEFLDSEKIPSVRLQKIFRQAQGSSIVMNATKIVQGLNSTMENGIELVNDPTKNFKFIEEKDSEKIKEKMTDLVDSLLANGTPLKDICVLTAMRKGSLGVEELNSIFQERYNPNPIKYEVEEQGIAFKVGDKIIQTKNNYDLHVFNGYIGTIVNIDEDNVVNGYWKPLITVEFENMEEPVDYMGEDISQLELAYVLTIHKSQGSEYPIVISPYHMEQRNMLNRNLLYTAVTRARTEYYAIGDRKSIDLAIDTELFSNCYIRLSRLSTKISKLLA